MCNPACLEFVRSFLRTKEVKGKRILDVGARNLNGSARDLFIAMKPREYIGTDIEPGPGVDQIVPAEQLLETFGENSFDVVVSTEMLEHVEDWRTVIHNLKTVLRPGGFLYITTRSKGFPYHEYPGDFWRYEFDDMHKIFADFIVLQVLNDPFEPGVFLRASKPDDFQEIDLSGYELYSMQTPEPPAAPGSTDYVPNDKPPHIWGIA